MNSEDAAALALAGGQFVKALFSRSDQNELESLEGSTEAKIKYGLQHGDVAERIETMKSALARLSLRTSQRLLPEVMKLISTPNLELKSLCYLYLALACQTTTDTTIASTALLAVNALQKDTTHRNHVVRGWSIRAMSSLGLREVIPSVIESLSRGVADGSPWTRYIVAQACPKLVHHDPSLVGFVIQSVIVRLLGDIEVSVVGAAFQALLEICSMHPELLSISPEKLAHNQQHYGLTDSGPFLGCLHYTVVHAIQQLVRLPPYGQVAAIMLLTTYFRTFLLIRSDSAHLETFLSKLEALLLSQTPSVALSAVIATVLLSEHSKVVPALLHQLRVAPYQSLSILCILEALCGREQISATVMSQILSVSWLSHQDSMVALDAKLNLWEAFASYKEFPTDAVLQDIFTALRWDYEAAVSRKDVLMIRRRLFTSVVRLTKMRFGLFREELSNEFLKELFLCLLDFALRSETPALNEDARRTLWVVLAETANRIDKNLLQSSLLCIAEQLIATLHTSVASNGQATAIALLASYHADAQNIVLDVFRVLLLHIEGLPAEAQLETLHMGARLWAASQTSQDTESSQRLDRLWKYLVTTLALKSNDFVTQHTARFLEHLTTQEPSAFATAFPTSPATEHDSSRVAKTSSQKCSESARARELKLWGTLSLCPLATLAGGESSQQVFVPGLWTLPPFISEIDLETGKRHVIPDSGRIRPAPPPDSSSSSVPITMSDRDPQDELESFFGNSHSAPQAQDPLVALFGQQGSVVFGQEEESDDDVETNHKSPQLATTDANVHPVLGENRANNNSSDDDDDDWAAIARTAER